MTQIVCKLGQRRQDIQLSGQITVQDDTANQVTVIYDRAMKLKDVYTALENIQSALTSTPIQDR